ncbi:helix-turn-helix transcriptional regulator [Zafaria sp. Z1313]|uniref:helix-turn-helix transcriptional regulator n=1 Tax=unclassified Zafaria TaxID=2828765 RepID=UPI002E77A158|nr:helix-turn-helix domain-containing protein [Zafaria sp. J156]MEE1622932.1 helix-turn-helix domain-containing protein [Zafaria sp. J156]
MTIQFDSIPKVFEPTPKSLLTAQDLSAQIGWSVSTIYRKRSLGEPMPRALKIGGHVRWRQADIDAWVEEQLEEQ